MTAAVAVALLCLVLGRPAGARESRGVTFPDLLVSAEELLERFSEEALEREPADSTAGIWRILDARPADRYRWGHIPGAIRLDPAAWPGDPVHVVQEWAERGYAFVSERDTVVCYSDRESPAAAGELFWIMELAGVRAVKVLDGGFEAWTTARGLVDTENHPPEMRPFRGPPDPTRTADFDYLLGHFGRPGFTVMDWRAPEDWAGGHVPHSLPFPLETLVDGAGRWISGKDMRARFAGWGPRERDTVDLDDEFIVLGGDLHGFQPIHPYLAARLAGIESVRFHRPGYRRWELQEGAPITRLIDVNTLRAHLRQERGRDFRAIDLPPADFILLDLRGVRDWQVGHIPGSIQVSPGELDERFEEIVATYWPGADRATVPVVAYCYGPTCIRSRYGTTIAAQHGFRKLEWFKDGVQGWRQAGEKLVEAR